MGGKKKNENGEPQTGEPPTNETAAEAASPAAAATDPEAVKPPAIRKRRGRFIGIAGRRFESVPFGTALVLHPGEEFDSGEEFAYLWSDPQFAHLFDWQEERSVQLADDGRGNWREPEAD